MMPQMNSSEEQYSYGQYEGSPSHTQRQNDSYDDNFVEALAQRIAQRIPQASQGKITDSRRSISAGQRLALAIVSVAMLVPLAGILMTGAVSGTLGLVAFGIACAAIFLINAVFNAMR